MALAIDTGTLSALNSGIIADRTMIKFVLAGGTYGFWSGQGTFNWDGIDYVGSGSLIKISTLTQVTDNSSVSVQAELSSIPDTQLTPDILAMIENEIYHQQPVTIYTAYFNIETRALLSVETEFRGRIDRLTHTETADGEYKIVGEFESISRDFLRTGFRMRTDVDQKTFAPNDGGLRHVQKAAIEKIYWGRNTPSSPKSGATGPTGHRSQSGNTSTTTGGSGLDR